jgi:WD40 repeat protein
LFTWTADQICVWEGPVEAAARDDSPAPRNPAIGILLPFGAGAIVSRHADGNLRLWEVRSGACRQTIAAHEGFVWGMERFGDRLVSWGEDRTIAVWDEHGTRIGLFRGHREVPREVRVLPESRLASWSAKDEELRLWTARGDLVASAHADYASIYPLQSWVDERGRVYFPCEGGCRFAALDPVTGLRVDFAGHADVVSCLRFFAGGLVVSCAKDGTLRSWDAETGACRIVFRGHEDEVEDLIRLGDGTFLTWSADGTLRRWQPDTGVCLAVLRGCSPRISHCLPLPSGLVLAWGYSAADPPRLWDPAGRTCAGVLEGHTDDIWGVVVIGDGRALSWSRDRDFRLWDVRPGSSGDRCVERVAIREAWRTHPEWLVAEGSGVASSPGWIAFGLAGRIGLVDGRDGTIRRHAFWHTDGTPKIHHVDGDGNIVAEAEGVSPLFLRPRWD